MDVSVKLSLQGGHYWEFICDESDPMVFGLVSALPGAKLDESLPPDGLVQVESRNGQRFFLSRSSLVAVTISRLPARPEGLFVGAPTDLRASDLLAPTPFVMRADLFDPSTAAALFQAATHSMIGEGLQETEMAALPPAAERALVSLLTEAERCLTREHCEDTHINTAVRRLSRRASARIPLPSGSRRLLDFVILLAASSPREGGIDLILPDRLLGADNATKTGRTLSVPFNAGLVFPDVPALTALDVKVAAEVDQMVILSGSLCEGVRVAAG